MLFWRSASDVSKFIYPKGASAAILAAGFI